MRSLPASATADAARPRGGSSIMAVAFATRCCRTSRWDRPELLLERNFQARGPRLAPRLRRGLPFRERRQSSGQDLYSTMRAGPDRLTWGGDHTLFGVGVAVGTHSLDTGCTPSIQIILWWRGSTLMFISTRASIPAACCGARAQFARYANDWRWFGPPPGPCVAPLVRRC